MAQPVNPRGQQMVWRFELPTDRNEFTLEIPRHGTLLDVQSQDGHGVLFALVNPDEPLEERAYLLVGSGIRISDRYDYMGTFVVDDAARHLFQTLA
jgi:hypothetical protein